MVPPQTFTFAQLHDTDITSCAHARHPAGDQPSFCSATPALSEVQAEAQAVAIKQLASVAQVSQLGGGTTTKTAVSR